MEIRGSELSSASASRAPSGSHGSILLKKQNETKQKKPTLCSQKARAVGGAREGERKRETETQRDRDRERRERHPESASSPKNASLK